MNNRFKHFCPVIFLCIFFSTCVNLEYSQYSVKDSPWQLVWQDEFSYTGLPDEEKWSYDTGGHGWGNGESQYYTYADPQNVWVENGLLTITAKHTDDQLPPDTWALHKNYTSTRLTTKNKATWTYGRFEIRAKVAPGRGLWSAAWLLSHDNPYGVWPGSGEIDIMEYVGFNPEYTHNAIHTRAYNHLRNTQIAIEHHVGDPATSFHTYALEWHPDRLLFFVDAVQTMEFRNSFSQDTREWPYDHPFYLILNLAVGGSWGALQGIDDAAFPSSMQVDFVRVFELRQ